MIRCSLNYYATDRFRWQMGVNMPSFASMRTKLDYHAERIVPVEMGWSHFLVPWALALRSAEPGIGTCAWEIEIKQTVDPRITSSAGDLLPGTTLDSLPNGETKATLVLRKSIPAGEAVSVCTADDLTLFTGHVVRSSYNAENDTWTVTAADPLSAQGLDEEFEIKRGEDAADQIPFEFLDLSERTAFPTVPVSDGITLRYWVQLLAALRGARLYYDPVAESYVLSDSPRRWGLKNVLAFGEEVDASQYFNLVVAEQDDSWEEPSDRKTEKSTYGAYVLTVDHAGEKIYSTRLEQGGSRLVNEVFEYDAEHRLIKQTSKKDTKTTTTTYLIQPGERPFIRNETSVTSDTESEFDFDERRIKNVDIGVRDERSLVARIVETREWWSTKPITRDEITPEPEQPPWMPPEPEDPPPPSYPAARITISSSGNLFHPAYPFRTPYDGSGNTYVNVEAKLEGGQSPWIVSAEWINAIDKWEGFQVFDIQETGSTNTSRKARLTLKFPSRTALSGYTIRLETKVRDLDGITRTIQGARTVMIV